MDWIPSSMADIDEPPRSKPPVSLEKWLGRLRKVERDGGAVVQNHIQALRASQKREAELNEKLKQLAQQLQETQLELQNQRDQPIASGALVNHDDAAASREKEQEEINRLNGLIQEKNRRLNERLRKLKEVRAQLRQKEEDLGTLEGGYQELNGKYLALKSMADSTRFVSVIIDEDSMRFRDDLVGAGEQGGFDAAQALRHTVLNYLKTLGSHPVGSLSPTPVVSIFRSKLIDPSRKDEKKQMTPFKRGFNTFDPSFNFVVTGTAEHLTLMKLRALFELHIRDTHCGHVVLGGTSDAFHKEILQHEVLYPYGKGTQPMRKRVTLLRVARQPDWRVDLSRKFKVMRAEGVFQDV